MRPVELCLYLCVAAAAAPLAALARPQTHLEAAAGQQQDTAPLTRSKRAPAAANKKQTSRSKKSKQQFLADCLAAHNKFRKLHGVPELQWDAKLAEFAQKRSDFIADSDGDEFRHPPDLAFGENLFWHSNPAQTCEFMVRGWYDEIRLYDFDKPTFDAATGHFTQVVWRETTRVGCASTVSKGPKGGVYLTCNYDPPGNFVGEFDANVPRPLARATTFRPMSRPTEAQSGARGLTSPASVTTVAPPATTSTTTTTTTTTAKPATTAAAATTKPKKKGKGKKGNKKKQQQQPEKNKKSNKKKKKSGGKKNKKTTKRPEGASSTAASVTTARPAR